LIELSHDHEKIESDKLAFVLLALIDEKDREKGVK